RLPRSPLFPYTTLFRSILRCGPLAPLAPEDVEFPADCSGADDRRRHGEVRDPQLQTVEGPVDRRPAPLLRRALRELSRCAFQFRTEEHTSELQSRDNLV